MKLRRVTLRSIFWVAGLLLICIGFIVEGADQYSQASQVCDSESTLEGTSCVSQLGQGTSSIDVSDQISSDHIGGMTLMVVGTLGVFFALFMIFSMWNFLSKQKIARLEQEVADSLEEERAQ